MAESTTFEMASTRQPRARASFTAASVSAVSPLWEIATTRSPAPDHRVAVAELARQIDLAGNARRALDQELADEAGVVRGPAGEQHHPPQVLHVDLEPLQVGVVGFEPQPGPQRVGDGARLLVDLLEHEVRVAALLRLRRVPGDGLRRARRRACRRGWSASTPAALISATSPSSRKITSRVCSRKAGTSEARNVSPLPSPMTSGEATLAATI